MADKFSNVSKVMTLTSSILATDGVINVNDATGLPLTFPYRLAIAYETPDVEIVLVNSAAGNALSVTRGQEDTPARPHSTGTIAVLVWTAKHATDTTSHIEQVANVHGVGSGNNVVGTGTTQTLTNKTISGSNNTITNIGNSSITSLDGSKLTGVITVATIAVANVTGNWPIDTRSTGNLPIDTRTTGNLPIDTRTSGNLPGSRLASPVTAAMTFNSAATFNNGIFVAGPTTGATATFAPTATPTASTVIATGNEPMPALTVRRNNSSSLGNALLYVATEAGAALLQVFRDGKILSTTTIEATDFLISGSPDRSVKGELDGLAGAALGLVNSGGFSGFSTNSSDNVFFVYTVALPAGRNYLALASTGTNSSNSNTKWDGSFGLNGVGETPRKWVQMAPFSNQVGIDFMLPFAWGGGSAQFFFRARGFEGNGTVGCGGSIYIFDMGNV